MSNQIEEEITIKRAVAKASIKSFALGNSGNNGIGVPVDERPAVINTYKNPIEGDLQTPAKDYSEVKNKIVFQCPVPQGAKDFRDGVKRSLRRNADVVVTTN